MLHWKIVRAADDPALDESRAPEGLLSPEEEVLLRRMRFEARRRKWLLGRRAAKLALTELYRAWKGKVIAPSAFTIRNEDSGAPFAELSGERLPVCLSISHRASHGVAAVDSDPSHVIGIDLELIEDRSPALARTFFTTAEQAALEDLDEAQRRLAVARLWSGKEAVLKALGLGLRRDTRAIEIGESPPTPAAALAPGFEPLGVRLAGELEQEVEGKLALGWCEGTGYLLTLAVLERDPASGHTTGSRRPDPR
ncbi:MAG: 4'-phosphopantetheinyl transferase superfamily protein [Deltaproteobacteria bacterium]|nr:4'-phosphopantetheinyl transferase superfamily protein [Deltaproteobacteria bacterium]